MQNVVHFYLTSWPKAMLQSTFVAFSSNSAGCVHNLRTASEFDHEALSRPIVCCRTDQRSPGL